MDVSANLPSLPEQPASAGELVVQNGRLAGTRRRLHKPMTLIGLYSACDVRLEGQGVSALHCVITYDQAGPILRDLDTPTGTRVNGQPIQTHRLAPGDVIEVGHHHLAVELDTPPTREGPSADAVLMDREREAIRIQAAAVAAQQAALTDEEFRLVQDATALERQEEQLASHLDERQRQLEAQEADLVAARTAFDQECESEREAQARERDDIVRLHADADRERKVVERQRQRTSDLRRRLWKRAQKQWLSREADVARREAALAADRVQLERERSAVRAFHEKVNGELELGRRTLAEEKQALAQESERLKEARERDRLEQQQRQTTLDTRAAMLAAGEQALATEQRTWGQYHKQLEREIDGLESRIRNQRGQLDQLQREAAAVRPAKTNAVEPVQPLPLSPALLPAPVVPPEQWPERLQELAEMLTDQRAHLAEQWQRLLDVNQQWHQERSSALADLEAMAEQLARREGELNEAEEKVRQARFDLERRQEELGSIRAALEGWRVRLQVEQTGWTAKKDELLGGIEARERLLAQRSRQLGEVQKRRNRRRKEELEQLQGARRRCDEAQRQYSHLWQECEQLRETLAQQERAVAAEALAVERCRQEVVNDAADSARTESKIEKLTRREASRLESSVRSLENERRKLQQERSRLDEEVRRLREQEAILESRQDELIRQAEDLEARQGENEVEESRRQEELRRVRSQHALDERQLRQLREEIERLARVLIEEAPEPESQQAA